MTSVLAPWLRRGRTALDDGRLMFWLMIFWGVAWLAQALFMTSGPLRAAGSAPYLVEGFDDGAPVGQTFRMHHGGLESIRLRFSADHQTRVDLRCVLLTAAGGGRDSWTPVYQWTASIDVPSGMSWQRFHFVPIAASDGVVYQFQVQRLAAHVIEPGASGAVPGLGLVASLDDSLPEGHLVEGTTGATDRDLFFEAQADDSGFAVFGRNADPHLPERLRSKTVQLAFLVLYTLALAVFLHELIVSAPALDVPPANLVPAEAARSSATSRAQSE